MSSCYHSGCYPYCNPNCITQNTPVTLPNGNFNLPCDGCKRQIFISAAPRANFSLTITNTGSCDIIVELTKFNSGISTTRTFTVNSGATSTVTDTNVINIFVAGIPKNVITCCNHYKEGTRSYTQFNNINAYNCYSGCIGTYSIT